LSLEQWGRGQGSVVSRAEWGNGCISAEFWAIPGDFRRGIEVIPTAMRGFGYTQGRLPGTNPSGAEIGSIEA
jgi:hypothetical protein